jgi:hypothetical protein
MHAIAGRLGNVLFFHRTYVGIVHPGAIAISIDNPGQYHQYRGELCHYSPAWDGGLWGEVTATMVDRSRALGFW